MLPTDDPSVVQFANELYSIANELNSLTRRLNILLRPDDLDLDPELDSFAEQPIESTEQRAPTPEPELPPPADELFIGDRVVILNNYQQLRGATGTVAGFKGSRVIICLDNSTRVALRSLHNVQLRYNRRTAQH